eukprot:COSAG01_NODE_35999_length_523_cov_249.511792_1_plen_98_part_10
MISWTEGIKLFVRFDPALWDITDHRMELLRGTATPTSTKHLTWKLCDPISMWLDNTSERSCSVPSGPGFECNRKRNYAYRNYRRNYGVIVTLLICRMR